MPAFICLSETDQNRSDFMSSCLLLQKVLSELQAENQRRLKEREQELKDMKKMMEGMKVGQQDFIFLGCTTFFLNETAFPINPAVISQFTEGLCFV